MHRRDENRALRAVCLSVWLSVHLSVCPSNCLSDFPVSGDGPVPSSVSQCNSDSAVDQARLWRLGAALFGVLLLRRCSQLGGAGATCAGGPQREGVLGFHGRVFCSRQVLDPATQALIARVPNMKGAETRMAIAEASSVFPAWSGLTGKERANVLKRWVQAFGGCAVYKAPKRRARGVQFRV
jgi:Aldehyde dehydrogenase family